MSLLATLTEKPWLTPGPGDDHPDRSTPAIGLAVFLCVVAMLFLLLTMAYLMHMSGHGTASGETGGHWHSMPKPPLLWANSGILLLSSFAWQAARRAARRGDAATLRSALIVGGGLGLAFLAGQLFVWHQLREAGYFLSSQSGFCLIGLGTPDKSFQTLHPFLTGSPAIAFFYLITALHGLHLLGGVAVWGHATGQVLRGGSIAAVRQQVDLCGLYWHFLLLVWLWMFGLFLLT